uniref:Probable E3 ubiquitin-protein ligase HERC4 n=1 Tax=Seriola dumerili TaxID=41447 RepID=A0A3B4TDV6_SERDU
SYDCWAEEQKENRCANWAAHTAHCVCPSAELLPSIISPLFLSDSRGQLGLGKVKTDTNSPQHLRSLSAIPLVQVAAGGEQSFALSVSGGVFGWGRNDRGQLGLGDTRGEGSSLSFSPSLISTLSQVACGSQHSVALTKDGQVYTWGQDSRGQLGLGKVKTDTNSPQHLRSLSAIPLVQVAAGGEQSFALSVSGGVFGWGRNDRGQLDRQTPTPVHYLNKRKTIHISCGTDHTAVLTKDGAVFTFGSGQYGQLGHNSFRDGLRPRLVAELWGAKVTKIACGRYSTVLKLMITNYTETFQLVPGAVSAMI